MSTKFMDGTPHAHMEMEMQQIPGFRPRRSGMTVSRFSYTPTDCVPFSALLEKLSAEVGICPFVARVSSLSTTETPFFSCDQHRRRF